MFHPQEIVLVRLGEATGTVIPTREYSQLQADLGDNPKHHQALDAQAKRQAIELRETGLLVAPANAA